MKPVLQTSSDLRHRRSLPTTWMEAVTVARIWTDTATERDCKPTFATAKLALRPGAAL